MDFLKSAMSEVMGNHDRNDEAPNDPPFVQPPWQAHWDGEAGRWIFINEATGERSWERPVLEEAAENFGREEHHLEQKWDDGVQNVEDMPQDAARWTGEAVGGVEHGFDRAEDRVDRAEDDVEQGWDRAGDNIEQGWDRTEDKVEGGWDNTVNAVEDAPENLAGWVGEGVGKAEHFGDSVEDFGDGMEASYDRGRDEERYD